MNKADFERLIAELETIAHEAGPGASADLAASCSGAISRLLAVCEDKERHLDAYRRAADEDKAEIDRLTRDRDAVVEMCVLVTGRREYYAFVGDFGPVPYRSLIKCGSRAEAFLSVRAAADPSILAPAAPAKPEATPDA